MVAKLTKDGLVPTKTRFLRSALRRPPFKRRVPQGGVKSVLSRSSGIDAVSAIKPPKKRTITLSSARSIKAL